MTNYLRRLKICSEHLREAGAEIQDRDLAYSMLAGLPKSYDRISMTLNNVEDKEFTSSKVKHVRLAEHERRMARRVNNTNETFQFGTKTRKEDNKKKNFNCYNCSLVPDFQTPRRSTYEISGSQMLTALSSTIPNNSWVIDSGATHHIELKRTKVEDEQEPEGYNHIWIEPDNQIEGDIDLKPEAKRERNDDTLLCNARCWRLSDWLNNCDRSGKIFSGIYRDEKLMPGGKKDKKNEFEERSYVVYSKQAAISRGRTAAYRRRRCTSWKILEGSTNFCLRFCSCFPSPCCSWHIEYYMSEGNEVLIAGDINIRIGNAGGFHNPLKLNSSLNKYRKSKDLISSKLSEKLISFTDSNSITIANGRTKGDTYGSFTFISERGSSVLDYFMYTHGLTQIISDMWIEELSYSDHLPIVLQINTGYEAIKSSYNNEILTRKFIWTKENVEMLKHNLSDIEDGNETDINTKTVNFTKQIYTAMESANIIKFAKRRHKLSKPWYDKDCYIMKKRPNDSDWANDIDDRRSTSGSAVTINDCLVSWRSKKQNCVSLSTMESEYIALAQNTKETLWIAQILENLKCLTNASRPKIIFCDNRATIEFSKNNIENNRSKHIDIRYHYIIERVNSGDIQVNYISTNDNLADIKGLKRTAHQNACAAMNCLDTGILHVISKAMMALVPEAWEDNALMSPLKKDFYRWSTCVMEPWDGPESDMESLNYELGRAEELANISKIFIPKPRDPTVVVKNVNKLTETANFTKTICSMNPDLNEMENDIHVLFSMKSNTPHYNIVLRVTPKVYQILKNINNKLYTDFERCFVEYKIMKWFTRIKSGNFDLGDEEKPGAPPKFEDEGLEARLNEYPTQMQKELAKTLGVTLPAIFHRLMEMGMIRKECTTDRRVRSHPLQCTTSRSDRQIVRMAVTDRPGTSRTVAQHIQSVTHHPVSARTIRRRLKQSAALCTATLVMHRILWGGIGYHSRNPLIYIAGTSNNQRYISEVLEPVVLQGFPTAIFQQDNARPHVARIVKGSLSITSLSCFPGRLAFRIFRQ
ncbi:hypothetical protein LAZ67_5002528 [Cordylochernes scorpioides]|uniref:Glutamine amidotransferase type-2 domain-containing protein n=1 Tax=Cordylochernes scorpioides TaxID=51811 RepID=A0ABY6KGF8_9ARAC|nr:hypothetical protein LAZ67_5002528 [Cordylochernes scorpioides]